MLLLLDSLTISIASAFGVVVVLAAYAVSENHASLQDFVKFWTDKDYNYMSFVFRVGKHLRFITDFPKDLRKASLEINNYYMDKKGDSEKVQMAKALVRRALSNDVIINDYFKGQYLTYKDFKKIKDICEIPEGDVASEMLSELATHLKYPQSAEIMQKLIVDVMTDVEVDFKNGKRQAALLKALNASDNGAGWEQESFANYMIKLGVYSGKFNGREASTMGKYSQSIIKQSDINLYNYYVRLKVLIDKQVRSFNENHR